MIFCIVNATNGLENIWDWAKEMRIFDIVKDINSLSIIGNTQYAKSVATQPLHFEIKPLPEYYINSPNIGDFIVFKVPIRVHPCGVNFILVIPKI